MAAHARCHAFTPAVIHQLAQCRRGQRHTGPHRGRSMAPSLPRAVAQCRFAIQALAHAYFSAFRLLGLRPTTRAASRCRQDLFSAFRAFLPISSRHKVIGERGLSSPYSSSYFIFFTYFPSAGLSAANINMMTYCQQHYFHFSPMNFQARQYLVDRPTHDHDSDVKARPPRRRSTRSAGAASGALAKAFVGVVDGDFPMAPARRLKLSSLVYFALLDTSPRKCFRQVLLA